MAGGWTIPEHLKRLLHPRLVSTRRAIHARARGQLSSADVSSLRPWATARAR